MEKYDKAFCETTDRCMAWRDTAKPCIYCGELTHATHIGTYVCGDPCMDKGRTATIPISFLSDDPTMPK